MPEFTLEPCPFCGGPKHAVTARYPARARGRRAPKPVLAGYEISCGMCGCSLVRTWSQATTKVSVRRMLAAAWNARAESADPNAAGFRRCPLCASGNVGIVIGHERFLAHREPKAVQCGACGLALVPPHAFGVTLSDDALKRAWNTRQSTSDFLLLQEAQCPHFDLERAEAYGFDELMWHLQQKWDELDGPPLNTDADFTEE